MTFQWLDLGEAGASLEFAASELAEVRSLATKMFGPVTEISVIDAQIWQVGADKIVLTNEWGDYALLAEESSAISRLRHLYEELSCHYVEAERPLTLFEKMMKMARDRPHDSKSSPSRPSEVHPISTTRRL